MPIYEYQCPKCGYIFEEWGSMNDADKVYPCPKCRTESKHIISNTAFVLKGGGWYVTDYGYRKNVSEDGGGSAQASSDSASGSEAAGASSANAAAGASAPASSAGISSEKSAATASSSARPESSSASPATAAPSSAT